MPVPLLCHGYFSLISYNKALQSAPTRVINRSLTFEVSPSKGIMTDMCEGKYFEQIRKFT